MQCANPWKFLYINEAPSQLSTWTSQDPWIPQHLSALVKQTTPYFLEIKTYVICLKTYQNYDGVSKTLCWLCDGPVNMSQTLEVGEGAETQLMLYRTTGRSKLDYDCIVYGTASNTNLRQLDSLHNSGLRLALEAFCTSLCTGQWNSFGGTSVKAIQALLSENSCMHWQSSTSCHAWI